MTTKGISEETVPLSKYQTLEKSYLELDEKVLKLEHELTWLKRNLFGKKSEKFIPHDQQMSLDIDVEPVEVPLEEEHIEYDRKKPSKKKEGHGRGHMPTHLPFKDTVIEPEEDTEDSRKIGEEITWELEYEPGSLFVHRYIRPKYVKKDDNSIIIGVLPARPIEKGNFGPGFITNMIIEKYLYHMPLYRQRQKFKLHYGICISESTSSDIIKRGAFWLDAVYEAAKKDLLKSTYLMADETTIPVMIKLSKKKLKKCYYWVYYDPVRKIIIFEYRKGRSQDGPDEFLSDFKNGILQIDGYAGYNNVVDKPDIVRAACMAHVRRKFE
jgi:transposase